MNNHQPTITACAITGHRRKLKTVAATTVTPTLTFELE